jgi:hypothetical protein
LPSKEITGGLFHDDLTAYGFGYNDRPISGEDPC